ncbi:MAG TPA: alpha-amylase, partial [Flavisolibacter sp.]
MSLNGVMMQYFHWYVAADGQHWNNLANSAAELAEKGITAVWMPPCYKGAKGGFDVGYGVYDLFDLGEFDQKGSVRTKYGTKDELLNAIRTVQDSGMQCYADVVFNHKDGGDETEEVWAQLIDKHRRNQVLSDWYIIKAYTRFTFPGRRNAYSSMQWHWWCFDSLSYDANFPNLTERIFRLKEKNFETEVSHEHDNYDYLLANDLDTSNEFVKGELAYWGKWFLEFTGVDGFRIDAVKHIRASFFPGWLADLRQRSGRELFSVGEYWSGSIRELHDYLDKINGAMSLFDVPLHFKFHNASKSGSSYDLRHILEGTLMKERPDKAVTFVENHDSQPCQMLESPVEDWFKPLAYALILLRSEGYPCVFHADYYGASYNDKNRNINLASHRWLIDKLLWARKEYNFGDQHDYFDDPNTIGWTRLGDNDHRGAMAVVLSNSPDGHKWMNMFRPNTLFRDITQHIHEPVITN